LQQQTEVRDETLALWDGQVKMHVKIGGSGPPLLYFHAASGLVWDPFVDRLAGRYTVYAPEHPGTSPEVPREIHKVESLWQLVLIYEEAIRRLDLDEKPVVVGQSFGGMMALELAAAYPGLFGKLVVLDPIGLWRDDAPVANWIAAPPQELPGMLFYDPEGEAAQAMFAMPEDPEAAVKAQAALVWAIGCTGKFVWPIPDKGLASRLHRVDVPTLVVWGREDRLNPVVYAEEFGRRIKGSRVEVIGECGHVPQAEQPEATYDLVSQFLAS
jgi:pimeloyl-ACP methyl ester carboxylesterase